MLAKLVKQAAKRIPKGYVKGAVKSVANKVGNVAKPIINDNKKMFNDIANKLNIEIHQTPHGNIYGLQWGESKTARILGMPRKKVIDALNWADSNNKEAEKIIKKLSK